MALYLLMTGVKDPGSYCILLNIKVLKLIVRLFFAMKFYDFTEEISSKKHSSCMSFYKEIFITVQYGSVGPKAEVLRP